MRGTTGLKSTPTPFLGRDRELALIGELCERATQGRGGRLLLEGPAGIGKTSLLQAARELAGYAGLEFASARGSELERDFPYGVVRQLTDPILRAQTPAGRAELLDGAAALAAPALGLATDRSGEVEASVERLGAEQGAAFHGLYWLFANLAERAPLLVSIDDAQWADGLSLRFLSYLTRRAGDLSLAVLVATRAGEAGGNEAIVERLSDEPDCATIHVPPISAELVETLVRAAFDTTVEERFTQAVQRAAGGNPFLVRELLLAANAEGIEPHGDQADRVDELGPDSVARAVRRRIEQLPREALGLAQAVAIVGDGAELVTAAALARLDPLAATRSAADLEAIEILVSDDDRVSFRHPILRAALYGSIPSAQRGLQHARAARLLSERGSSARAAAQLLRTPPVSDPWVIELLRDAARGALATGAPDTAAAYLQRALAEAPEGSDRAELLRELGVAEAAAGSPHGVRHLREAMDALPDPVAKAATARDLARALAEELRLGEAAWVLVDAIGQLGDRDRELWLLLESDLLERRVAELAAAGQTNKQIAQALFVSTRTVETHVRHALQKLNITSRDQLSQHLTAQSTPQTSR